MVTAQDRREFVVVCVDDDMKTLGALRRTLRGERFRVMTTALPHEALHWVKSGDVDVVVSDIYMDGMNGLSLLAEVRRCSPSTRRVAITGHPRALLLMAERDPDLSVAFTKPWNEQTLRLAIERFAAERHAARDLWAGREGRR